MELELKITNTANAAKHSIIKLSSILTVIYTKVIYILLPRLLVVLDTAFIKSNGYS